MSVFFGGLPIQKDEEVLKNNCPHIVVGTPGRILALVRTKKLNLKNLKHFILDECDKMLELLGNYLLQYASDMCYFQCNFYIGSLIFRYEEGCPGDLPQYSAQQTSDDVQRHTEQGYPTSLQEVHARRNHPSIP